MAAVRGRKGKGGKGGGAATSSETPNTLQSRSTARFLEIISHGETIGLANQENPLKSVFFDGVPCVNDDGTANFKGLTLHQRFGLPNQEPFPGFNSIESEVAGANGEITFSTPRTIAITTANIDAVRVRVQINALSQQDDETGNIVGSSVSYKIQRRVSGGAWQDAFVETLNDKATSAQQLSYRINRPAAAGDATNWDVRVVRLTPDAPSVKVQNSIALAGATLITDSTLQYSDLAGAGLEVDSEQFGSSIPGRAYDYVGMVLDVPSNYVPPDYDSANEDIAGGVYNFTEDQEGFFGIYANLTWTNGRVVVAPTGAQVPEFWSPALTYTGSANDVLRVRVKVNATGPDPTVLRVYWRNTSNGTYYSSSLSASVITPGVWQTLEFPVGSSANWAGQPIISIRVDPVGSARGYEVESVKFGTRQRYYSGLWDGTFKRAWTDNPAWILWAFLTDKSWGLGRVLDASQIDKWALYQIGQYCDEFVQDGYGLYEPRYSVNTQITSAEEAYAILQSIASTFRGMLYWGSGAVTFVADQPRDPVKLVTPANVINGEFNYQGSSLKSRHSVVRVTWNDPSDGHRAAIEVVEDPEMIERYGWRPTDVIAYGCTSRGQANRMGRWLLDTEKNESEVVNYQASFDHVDLRPGDIISIHDPSYSGVRSAGRITAIGAASVTLDAPFTLEADEVYKINLLRPDGTLIERTITSAPGTRTVLGWSVGSLASVPAPQTAELTTQGVPVQRARIYSATTTSATFNEAIELLPGITYKIRINANDGSYQDRTILTAAGDEIKTVTWSGALSSVPTQGALAHVHGPSEGTVNVSVTSFTATTATLSAGATLIAGRTYVLKITSPVDGNERYRTLTNPAGTYTILTWDESLTDYPVVGSMWGIVSTTLEPRQFRVMGVAESAPNVFDVAALEYDPDKYARIEQGLILPERTYSVLQSTEIPQPPTNLTAIRRPVLQADGAYADMIELNWDPSPTILVNRYKVSYKYENMPWVQLPDAFSDTIEFQSRGPGTYSFSVVAVNFINKESTALTVTLELQDLRPFAGARIRNIRLWNTPDQTYGPPVAFTGSDLKIEWSTLAPVDWVDPDVTDWEDPYLGAYRVRLLTAANVEVGVFFTQDRHFTITKELNTELSGGSPMRTFKVAISMRDTYGFDYDETVQTFTNPAPVAPTVTITNGTRSFMVNVSPCDDLDYGGTMVWVSTTNNFNPLSVAPMFVAPQTSFTVAGNTATPYYVRAAHFDDYSSLPSELNRSAQVGVNVPVLGGTDIGTGVINTGHIGADQITSDLLATGENTSPPTNLAVTSVWAQDTDGSAVVRVSVTWTAPVSNANLTRYEVGVAEAGGGEIAFTTSSTSYAFITSANRAVAVRVRAISYTGARSSWTAVVNHTTAKDTTAPSAPTDLGVTTSFTTAFLDWLNASDADVARVEVWETTTNVTPVPSGSVVPFAVVNAQPSKRGTYTRAGLLPGSTRYYWLRSVDTSGNVSAFTSSIVVSPVNISTADLQTGLQINNPAAPTLAASYALDPATGESIVQVTANWTQSAETGFSHYEIAFSEGVGSNAYVNHKTSTNTYTIRAKANTRYNAKLRAFDKLGNVTGYTTIVTIDTAKDSTIPATVNVTGATITPTFGGFFLRWTNPSDADLDAVEVYENTTNTTTGATLLDTINAVPGGQGSYARTGLGAGVTRYYFFKTRDSSGNVSAAFSTPALTSTTASLTIDDIDTTAPSVPVGLGVTYANTFDVDGSPVTTLIATWTAVAAADLGFYEIALQEAGGNFIELNAGNTSPPRFETRVRANVSYGVKVRAADKLGNRSAYSSVVTTTSSKDSTLPSLPTGLAIEASVGALFLSWTNVTATPDLAGVEVWESAGTTNTTTGATRLTTVNAITGQAGSFVRSGVGRGFSRYYYLKSVDTSGNVSSTFTAGVQGVVPGVASDDLDNVAPSTPTNLALTSTVVLDGAGNPVTTLIATWTASPETDVLFYELSIRDPSTADPFIEFNAGATTRWERIVPANANFSARVRAVDKLGNRSAYSSLVGHTTAADTTAPALPSGVSALGGFTSNTLTWTNVPTTPDLRGVQVFTNTTNTTAGATLLATVNARTGEAGSYVHAGLGHGVTAWYFLRSVDGSNNVSSSYTAGVSATTSRIAITDVDNVAPNAPTLGGSPLSTLTSIDVDGNPVTTLVFVWNASSSSDVDSYEVAIKETGGNFVEFSANGTRFEVSARANVSYTAKVRAVDRFGNRSAYTSDAVYTTLKDATLPGVPTSPSATAGFGSIVLNWTNVAATNDLVAVEVWEHTTTLTLANVASTATQIATVNAATGQLGSYRRDGLGYGVTRYYWLRSVDSSGNVSNTFSTGVSATTVRVASSDLDNVAPSVPAFTTFATISSLDDDGRVVTRLVANWGAVADAALSHYEIAIRETTGGSFIEFHVGNVTRYEFNARANVGYTLKIRAVDRVGNRSAYSAESTYTTTKDTTLPGLPTGHSATAGFGSVVLNWTNVTNTNDLAGVEVWEHTSTLTFAEIPTTATRVGTVNALPGRPGSYRREGLPYGSARFYWLRSVDASGNVSSGFTTTVTATPVRIAHSDVDTTPPAVPALTTFATINTSDVDGGLITRLVANWNAVGDADLHHYELAIRETTGGNFVEFNAGSATRYEFVARANVGYTIKIRAVDDFGNRSAWSADSAYTTLKDATVPGVPTSVAATAGLGAIYLTWTNVAATPDLDTVEVWEHTTTLTTANVASTATLVATVNAITGQRGAYARVGLPTGATGKRYYWLRSVDTSGNNSGATTFSTEVNATPSTIDVTDITPDAQPLLVVSALPTAAGYTGPQAVILQSNRRVYRYVPSGSTLDGVVGPGWSAAVSGSQIVANSITGDRVQAGAISTDQLAANAITASKLFISDTINLLLDPDFDDLTYWTKSGLHTLDTTDATMISAGGRTGLRTADGNGTPTQTVAETYTRTAAPATTVTVEPGARYHLQVDRLVSAGYTGTMRVRWSWFNGANAQVGGSTQSAFGTTYEITPNGGSAVLDPLFVTITAPADAHHVRIGLYNEWSETLNNAGYGIYFKPRLTRAVTGELIVNGAITTDHMTANSISGDRITANTISGDRFVTTSSLPGTITVGSTGVQIETVRTNAALGAQDPGTRINAGTTKIDPGLITISGVGTTLADWRQAGDLTRIAGGSISANTIDANRLTIGLRGVQTDGIVFSTSGNVLSWTAGVIVWANDGGSVSGTTISAGSYTWVGGRAYIYWDKGATVLTPTTASGTATLGNSITLATYSGGNQLYTDYGRTIIDGDYIKTGTIVANHLSAGSVTATKLYIGDTSNMIPDPELVDISAWSGVFTLQAVASNGGPSRQELVVPGSVSTLDVFCQPFSIEGGRSYTASSWLAVSGTGTDTAELRVAWYSGVNAGGSLLSVSSVGTASSTTPARVQGIVTAPAGARSVRIAFRKNGGNTRSAVFSGPQFRRAADGELIVDGSITSNSMVANTINGNVIEAGTLNVAKLATTGSLPATLTIGPTGAQLGVIEDWVDGIDTTRIDPGKIIISGSTYLSSWRQGTDLTKIAGGSISANTIDANKLTIGLRGIKVNEIVFSTSGNTVSWTGGSILWYNDTGTAVGTTITGGSANWPGAGRLYIYWAKGATTLTPGSAYSTANSGDNVALALYDGGNALTVDVGRTIIDGDFIKTGSIVANHLSAGSVTATKLYIGETSNMVPDPDLVDASAWTGLYTLETVAANGGPSRQQVVIAGSGVITDALSVPFNVEGSRSYSVSAFLAVSGTGTDTAELRVYWYSSVPGATPVLLTTSSVGTHATTTPTRYQGVLTAPATARSARVMFRKSAGTTRSAIFSGPQFRRAADGELIVDGSITSNSMVANSINGNVIEAGTLNVAKLTTTGNLPATLVIGPTGATLGQVSGWRNTADSTKIDPGAITVSGSTTLADWRKAGDETRIDGGDISANTITANKINIGQRGITIEGLEFEHGRPIANRLYWTDGSITYTDNNGVQQTVSIAASNTATWTTGTLYVYWTQGATALSSTASISVADTANTVVLAAYRGGYNLTTNYGRTIIDGSTIKTGTILAAQLSAGAVTASKLQVGDPVNLLQDPDLIDASYWNFAADHTVVDDAVLAAAPYNAGADLLAGRGATRAIVTGTGNGTTTQTNTETYTRYSGGLTVIPVEPGARYRLSAWTYVSPSYTGRVLLRCLWYDENGATIGATLTVVAGPNYTVAPNGGTGVFEKLEAMTPVVPVNAYRARIGLYTAWSTTLNNAGYAVIFLPRFVRAVTGELIVDGTISTVHMTANTINGDRITAETLSVAKLATTGNLPANLVLGPTGATLGQVNGWRNVNDSTKIDPGVITVSGSVTLADWRKLGDETRIDGGDISANTITANKINIGQRGVTIEGLEFEHNRPATNQVFWTGGTISYTNDAGAQVSVTITSSSATWTSGTLYLYWTQGATTISNNASIAVADTANTVVLATYRGGTNLVANYGRTVIDGATIKTGTVTATQINGRAITADQLAVGTLSGGLITNGTAESGSLAGWSSVPGQTSGTGTDSLDVTTVDKNAGNYGFAIVKSAAARGTAYGTLAFPVVPGKTYAARAFIKGNAASTNGFYLRINYATSYPANGILGIAQRTGGFDIFANSAIPAIWELREGTFTVPAGIGWASVQLYCWVSATTSTLYFDDVEVYEQSNSTMIADGAITTDHMTVNTISGDRITSNSINAAKIATIGSLPGTLTVGTTGVTIEGTTKPLDIISGVPNTTTIDPGKIRITGTATAPGTLLSDWRKSGDETRIDGGSISANTIDANKLTIGQRGVKVNGIVFSTSSNFVSWTGGTIVWINDAGVATTTTITNGSGAWPGAGRLYVYWAKGATTLSTDTSFATANTGNNLTLAVYEGGNALTVDVGRTIIDGDFIQTGTISTTHLSARSITADKLLIGAQDNLLADGDFAGGMTSVSRVVTPATSSVYSTDSNGTLGWPSRRNLVLARGATAANEPNAVLGPTSWDDTSMEQGIPVTTGEQLYLEAFIWASASGVAITFDLAVRTDSTTTISATPNAVTGGVLTASGAYLTASPGSTITKVAGFYTVTGSGKAYVRVRHATATANTSVQLWSVRLRRKATGQLVVNGAITTDHMTANTINGTVIEAGTLNVTKLQTTGSLPATLTLGATGATLGQVAGWRNTSDSTKIDPGAITVSGSVTLADWRQVGDQTKIAGGNISTNTISSGKLKVNARAFNLLDVDFSTVRTQNKVTWTSGGSVQLPSDGDTLTTHAINTGPFEATWSGSTLYLYWITTAPNKISYGTDATINANADAVVLATYYGGSKLIDNYGGTIIDGDRIITNSITSAQIAANTITTANLIVSTPSIVPDPFFQDPVYWNTPSTLTVAGANNAVINPGTTGDNGWVFGSDVANTGMPAYITILTPRARRHVYGPLFKVNASSTLELQCARYNGLNTQWIWVGLRFLTVTGATAGDQGWTFAQNTGASVERLKITVPSNAYVAQVLIYNQAAGTASTGAAWVSNLTLREAVSSTMIVNGSILTDHMTANSINGDRIEALTLNVGKLQTTGSLPASLTLGATGATLGNVAGWRLTTDATKIDPGAILVSGSTTVADWRQGGDLTKIAGGSISANTISANKLKIGLRGFNLFNVDFSTVKATNTVNWTTGGFAQVADDNGEYAAYALNTGVYTATYVNTPIYIYWKRTSVNQLQTTTDATITADEDAVVVATYYGGSMLIDNHGGVIIDGDRIVANSITAAQIQTNSLTAAQIAASAITTSELAVALGSNSLYGAGTPIDPNRYLDLTYNPSSIPHNIYQAYSNPGVTWSLPDRATVALHQPNGTGAGANYVDFTFKRPVSSSYNDFNYQQEVFATNRYMFSCYMATHRCSAGLGITFYAADGTTVTGTVGYAKQVNNASSPSAGNKLSDYTRIQVVLTAPANSVSCVLNVRKWNTNSGSSDSWVMISRPAFENVPAGASVPLSWAPGPLTLIDGAGIIANTVVGNTIVANTINGDRLIANTLTADRITANSISTDRIQVGGVWTTNIQNNGVTNIVSIYADSVISATSGTYGGGGVTSGGDPACVVVEAFTPEGCTIGEVIAGDAMTCLNAAGDGYEVDHVRSTSFELVDCVRLTTEFGVTISCSVSTPIVVLGRSQDDLILPRDALGLSVPVLDRGNFGWERVVLIEELGVRTVAHVSLGGRVFAAGDQNDRYVFTHNPNKP